MPPIRPEQVTQSKRSDIPEEIFDAFNEMIVRHIQGKRARFSIDEVCDAARKRGVDVNQALKNHHFDVESIYEAVGWKVVFDKSGWNEPTPDYFVFTKP